MRASADRRGYAGFAALRHGLWRGGVLLFVLALAACSNQTAIVHGGGATIAAAQAEAVNGSKYRIAVGAIIDKSSDDPKTSLSKQIATINRGRPSDAQLSDDGVIGGIHDLLIGALFNSDRFIVLERRDLNAALVEQEFSQSARVGDQTRLPLGQLEGAELLVVGALTAFDAGAGSEGGAIPIPIPLGNDAQYGWGVLNISYKRGYAAMDLRVIDVASGRVVASTAVTGKNTKWGLNLTGLLNIGGNTVTLPNVLKYFSNTPIEEALRKMVDAAIGAIAAQQPSKAVVSPAAASPAPPPPAAAVGAAAEAPP